MPLNSKFINLWGGPGLANNFKWARKFFMDNREDYVYEYNYKNSNFSKFFNSIPINYFIQFYRSPLISSVFLTLI